MTTDLIFLALGSVGLYFGAEWLVRGASGLARAMGVSRLAVGLTVVAYGTSMPELVVSLVSAVDGKSALALGNVMGSNIANLGVILGLTAIISPPNVQAGLMRRELPTVLLTLGVLPLVLWNGVIGRVEGAALLLGAIAFTRVTLKAVTPSGAPKHTDTEPPPRHSRPALAAFVVLGLALLLGGGKLFVDGAVGLALRFGMSERLVGLTVVAVGTSLPELAASLVAALRGESEIAVGNVLGSNIFNVLLILGVTALAHPIEGSLAAVRFDLVAMAALTGVAVVSMRTARRIQRVEGAVLVAGYAAFLIALAVKG
ncbi:MAG: calcium/sodium antiporter [Polyangiaceae bacterium]|nr:calcium/sodium antiporter [Polyangiaceae bacterium]